MRVACWQAGQRPAERGLVARLRDAAAKAAGEGADLLVTPELSAVGYHLGRARTTDLAEPADGPLRETMSRLAASAGLAVVYGWPEAAGGGVYNAVQLIDAHGEVAAHYRKTHLYGDFDTATFLPGDRPVVQARVGGVTVGLLICYDVEFPEIVRAHALRGTELLAVPTALSRPWELVARTLVAARAFESQLFIAYTNWVGTAPDGYCGLSRVVGPDGLVIAASEPAPAATPPTTGDGKADGEALLVADVDPAALAAARRLTPYLGDRRPELYGDLTGPA
ncbi:carbon-nitrogen hydrolase family protein [Parafrankia discariae]|uniref:carbon-nitrogen hydrolase family protein n=1 Tax=Parafrankia discariae TaxID=365528 RepID=UPI000376C701|nr:carbon-nitrogen hydrolase family protein [Parafrankia discariae]